MTHPPHPPLNNLKKVTYCRGDEGGKRDPSSSLPEGCPIHPHFNGPYNPSNCLFLLIYIVPKKPLWGGNNKVCMCVYYVIHVTIRTGRMD